MVASRVETTAVVAVSGVACTRYEVLVFMTATDLLIRTRQAVTPLALEEHLFVCVLVLFILFEKFLYMREGRGSAFCDGV